MSLLLIGVGNFFHQQCVKAMKGETEFQFIFVPWFWQKEYTKTPPKDFERTDTETQLRGEYKLSDGQLFWRRK